MARSLSTYIIVIAIVIVAILAISFILNSNLLRPRITPTTTVTTTINGITTVVNSTTTFTSNSPTGCLSANQVQAIFNGNFSTGNFLGWNTTGPGFGSAPENVTYENSVGGYYGAPWSGYNGTYFASTFHGGTAIQTGNLTSQPFKVTEPYLNFKLVSPQDAELYVEILANGKPFLINHYDTAYAPNNQNAQSTFVNASIPIVSLVCQNVSVRVVSEVVGQRSNTLYDYIAAGDFYMGKTSYQSQGILINSTVVAP